MDYWKIITGFMKYPYLFNANIALLLYSRELQRNLIILLNSLASNDVDAQRYTKSDYFSETVYFVSKISKLKFRLRYYLI